MEVDKLLSEI